MNPRYFSSAEEFREQVRAFLARALPDGWRGLGHLEGEDREAFVGWWRGQLAAAGYLAPGWPQEYGGGGFTPAEQVVLAEELVHVDVPSGGPNDAFGIDMLGNTILHWGTDAQRRHHLPRILSGADVWCQGFSEPQAGSDLSNIGLRARLDGNSWVLSGQKVWTSAGQRADHIFALARTDPAAPRHDGLTLLLVDMRQPGVEVRPIRMMSGPSEFNEVFFTDARCPVDSRLGAVGDGWKVAMTLLGFERGVTAATLPLRFAAELDRLIALAKQRGAHVDPVIRQGLADAYARTRIMRFMGLRALTRYVGGHPPGPEAAIAKLYWTEHHRAVTELAVDIVGADALVPRGRLMGPAFQTDDVRAPNSSNSWVGAFLGARAGTIYAGSSEIQRNIVGELILDLPKEPRQR